MTNLIITTPEDLARIFEEVLARHQPPAQPEAGLMKLETASEYFEISVRSLRRMAEDGKITLYQAEPKQGSPCRVDPGQVREALTKVKG